MKNTKKQIAIKPKQLEMIQKAVALHQAGRLDEAEAAYRKVLGAIPAHPDLLTNLAAVVLQKGKLEEGLQLLSRSLAIAPNQPIAWHNRGNALKDLQRPAEAVGCYDKAISCNPNYAKAYVNRGIVQLQLGNASEALASCEQAIGLNPIDAEAFAIRGTAQQACGSIDQALSSYDAAVALNPYHAEAFANRGVVLQTLGRNDEALASCERAIALNPGDAEVYANRGNILNDLKRVAEALHSFEQALAINPDLSFVPGELLFARLVLCRWDDLAQNTALVLNKVTAGLNAANPLNLLAMTDDLALQGKAARRWSDENCPAKPSFAAKAGAGGHQRIRLGYFSGDFHQHPVALLSAQLFELHDRNRFEVYGFSFGTINDDMTHRLQAGFEHFTDIRQLSDQEVVQLVRSLEIDIAVDLGGHTADSRNTLFALRMAPLQVSYLGYAGTLGTDYMDYLLADSVVLPEASRVFYAEKIAYLPDSFLVNDNSRTISAQAFSRQQLGLPEAGFVFCCFNNSYKLNPDIFACWMRILSQVPESVLWLSVNNPQAQANLQQAAINNGIAAERLFFAPRMPLMADHLARLQVADLFLDTLPYNAHSTASDALWAGLPVLTCLGQSFAGRVAASLLHAINMPELVMESQPQYEALAIELALNPGKLAGIKAKLAVNRLNTALFDTELFTHNLEAVYSRMYDRQKAGLPVEHLLHA
jgi:predicted O-linked N-acetylglucosamine transferase (SPINDLY family)